MKPMLLAALAGASIVAAPAAAQDDNPRCRNAIAQFQNIKHHGEALAFHPGVSRPTSWTGKNHIQGITRSNLAGVPYMFVSISGDIGQSTPGSISVVRLDSRGVQGERLRSNRLATSVRTEITAPPASDAAVARIDFSAGDLAWAHVGNMAVIGEVLLVPLEDALGSQATPTGFALFDVANPEEPTPLHFHGTSHAKAGTCGITRLEDGRYLVIIGGVDGGHTLVGYVSTTTSLRDPNLQFNTAFTWSDTLNDFGNTEFEWPIGLLTCAGKEAHQSYTFVTQDDGQLFLIGMSKRLSCGSPTGNGYDTADLFRVTYPFAFNGMRLEVVGAQHLYCSWDEAGFNGNFVAGSSAYVGPSGTLMMYGAPHGMRNFGAVPVYDFVEFRERGVTVPRSAGPATMYLELYEDPDFSGRSLVLDREDRALETWYNLGNIDDFNDKASSVVWSAPVGTRFVLWTDSNYTGIPLILEGTGEIETLTDLAGFADQITSVQLVGTPGSTVFARTDCQGCTLGLGTAAQPVVGITRALSMMTDAAATLSIFPGTYEERPTFARPMVIQTTGAPAIIDGR